MASGIFMGGISKGFAEGTQNALAAQKLRQGDSRAAMQMLAEQRKAATEQIAGLKKEIAAAVTAGKGEQAAALVDKLDQTGQLKLLGVQAGVSGDLIRNDLLSSIDLTATPEEAGAAKAAGEMTGAATKYASVMPLIEKAKGLVSEQMNTGDEDAILAGERQAEADVRAATGLPKMESTWSTLSESQVSALGLTPRQGMVIQQDPNTKEIKVISAGDEMKFTPALDRTGKLVFATREQLASGEVNPVPPQSLVNIHFGGQKPGMNAEGELAPMGGGGGGAATAGAGQSSPATAVAAPATEEAPADEKAGTVGMFPFLNPKDQFTQKARTDSLKATQALIDKIVGEIGKDPSNFGIVGTGKRILQTGSEVIGDLGTAIQGATGVDITKGIKSAAKMMRLPADVIDSDFNETLPKQTLWQNTLAMELAKLRIQSGDDVRAVTKAYDAAKSDVDLTGLFSAEDVKNRLLEIKGQFAAEEKRLIKTLSGKDKKEAAKAEPTPAEQRVLEKLRGITGGQGDSKLGGGAGNDLLTDESPQVTKEDYKRLQRIFPELGRGGGGLDEVDINNAYGLIIKSRTKFKDDPFTDAEIREMATNPRGKMKPRKD